MLTQAEIDALLAGSIEAEQPDSEEGVNLAELMGKPTAGPPGKQKDRLVRPYNFWSPERFSKDQMRAVELIHEDLAERLTNSLAPYLRTEVRPRVVHIEQGRFDYFLKDMPPTTLFHMLSLEPLPGRVVLTISGEVSWVILDRLLGGAGEQPRQQFEMTEISISLLKGVVENMLNDIKSAWSKVVPLEPRLEDSTVNHHWVQMVVGNARMMLVTFELAIQGVTGAMCIYVPFASLKPVADVLNPHVWIAGREEQVPDRDARQTVRDALRLVNLPLRVLLGSAELTVSELAGLQPGDVVRLSSRTRNDLLIHVADRPCFRARVGRVSNRLAVQISSIIQPLERAEVSVE
jgi:flagellar motor switch protein FliM